MRGPWPVPGPHGVLGDLFGATFGVGAVVFGIFAATIVFVAVVALLILVVRFLVTTTKAAELYIAERRAADSTPTPSPAEPAGTTAPRTRTPRTPRTPPSA